MSGDPAFSWMTKHGEMAGRIRNFDWSKTSIGEPIDWPQSLKTAINVCLSSKIPMYVLWGDENTIVYNDAYIAIAGAQRHPRYLGRPGEELFPEVWPTVSGFLEQIYRTGETICREDMPFLLERHGHKEECYFTFSFGPAFDDDGEVAGAIAIVQENTGKVLNSRAKAQAETEVRSARQELHDFLMQAPVGICLLSGSNHVFTLANSVYMNLLFGGHPEEYLLGKPVRKAVPEVEGQGFYEILDEVYRTGVAFKGSKLRITLKQPSGENKEMFVNFIYQAKRNLAGKISGILVVIYEVTDQVNEQEEIELLARNLQSAIVSRDTFLGIASHELNTPLTTLKMQMQMTRRQLKKSAVTSMPTEDIDKLIGDTLFQIQRLEVLVNDMLDVSRISSGKLTMHMAKDDLSATVKSVLERFLPQLESVGCSVKTQIESHIQAHFDASRIEQVLVNFITNVIKYAPKKELTVTVETLGKRARVSFRDQGAGIPKEHLDRIFGQFERAITANEVSGLGLGLYICKQIIREHNGKIYAESELGKGSNFVFELPV